MFPEYVEIPASCIFPIESDTTVALYAAVHLVIYERAEVLVPVSKFRKFIFSINVPGHDRHILKMTFAAFITDWAIMRVVNHEPLDDTCPEFANVVVIYGNPGSISRRGHTRHNYGTPSVFFVPELFYGAHTASANSVHSWMPTEIRNIESQRKTCAQKILSVFDFIGGILYKNSGHPLSPRTTLLCDVPFKVFSKAVQCALQWLHRSWRECAKGSTQPK